MAGMLGLLGMFIMFGVSLWILFFLLQLLVRFVSAFEKISDTYEKSNRQRVSARVVDE